MKLIIYHEKDMQRTIDQITDFAVEELSKYPKEKLESMYKEYIAKWRVSSRYWYGRALPLTYSEEQDVCAEINRRLGTDLKLEFYCEEYICRHYLIGLIVRGKKL